MPVTRPLFSCSPFLSFQSALRASGKSCAQCPWFLHNLHFVQLEKSCSLLYTQSTFLALLVRPAAVVLAGEQSRSGRISMHPAEPLGRWVFYTLAVPASPYFHVGNTNILWVSRFWWCRHIQIDFHTFHFSFLLTLSALAFFLFYLLP